MAAHLEGLHHLLRHLHAAELDARPDAAMAAFALQQQLREARDEHVALRRVRRLAVEEKIAGHQAEVAAGVGLGGVPHEVGAVQAACAHGEHLVVGSK